GCAFGRHDWRSSRHGLDIGQTKGQSGQSVTASNFRTDLNVSGVVNALDIGIAKQQSGTALP
ncbi:MAG TPA: hypothetical protein VGI85_13015, partial [Chthoniobacterales bacterium]